MGKWELESGLSETTYCGWVNCISRSHFCNEGWLKHGTGALATLLDRPIFSSYSTVLVEAVPPARSAQVVRIKLAAHKLAELAGHTEAVL